MAKGSRARGEYGRNRLERQRRRPSVRPRVLIVCEGAKTEPLYFGALRKHKRLAAQVVICGEECGTHPNSVVDYAVSLRKEADAQRVPYDAVWCVFDRDEHEKIHEAHCRARDCGIKVAFSNPCFEIWCLLHYRYSTAHVERGDAERELRNYVPGYTKSADVYEALVSHQQAAFTHAARLRKHHADVNEDHPENPSTSVDRLVQELNALAEQ